MEQLWPLSVLATPLRKHGREHFSTRSRAVTQCTRSVNSTSLFIHSECALSAWVLCYGITLIQTQGHFVLRERPQIILPFGWIRPFFTKSDPRGHSGLEEKKRKSKFFSEGRTGHFVIEGHSSSTTVTFAHNASQHISLDSKLASHLPPLCASNTHTHMQMST